MTRPVVVLNQPLEAVIQSGHPWLFDNALYPHDPLRPGTVVDVLARDGAFLASGVYEPESPLRVRVWTLRPDVVVDNALLEGRVRSALRARPFPDAETTGYRLLNGEGDRTPGLVCDVYEDVAVIRVDGVAAERWLGPLTRIVRKLAGVEHVAVRRSERHRGSKPAAEWSQGGVDEVWFLEHGLRFVCDPIKGQKTGFFLDQRANRQRLARLSRGRRLLNLFGYTGGFSVAAAAAGAAWTTTVDLAAPALDDARRNFAANGIPPETQGFEASDVFDYLERFGEGSAPFDVIICDPPSFAHRRDDLERASRAYVRLFAATLRAAPSRCHVALASCSSHIHRERFLALVAEASAEAGVALVLSGVFGADVDHPTLAAFPEGDYLQLALGVVHRD